ncbi:MAG: peptidylprolyl isomerase [Rhizobiaceae bacterium]|nr:peptidylprolyl isomerase [Rhizobiaceae bacterium]
MTSQGLPRAALVTPLGLIEVSADIHRAPITAGNFMSYVDGRHLDGTSFYRIVSRDNQSDDTPAKIEVVQFGLPFQNKRYAGPLPCIPHEPTSVTGLGHHDGTLSMARFAPGSAGSGFFICVGDQPELDFGGRRQPDGLGFAAFGRVEAGMDVVRAILARAEPSQLVANPVPLIRAERIR